MFHFYAMGASFLGTFVEFVEALTIILAVGTVRGWRSSLSGALAAVVLLGALVAIIGAPLVAVIQVGWVQFIVGLFMLMFGIRWLRKAILRYAGLKALHDEAESYQKELVKQQRAGQAATTGIDKIAFVTTFSGTFLEGLEAIFIVITVGLSANALQSTILGGAIATVVVVVAGIILRKPMSLIPENTMKFVVGIMLTSFGTFWVGESLAVPWPQKDASIAYMAGVFLLFSWLLVLRCKRGLRRSENLSNPSSGVSS